MTFYVGRKKEKKRTSMLCEWSTTARRANGGGRLGILERNAPMEEQRKKARRKGEIKDPVVKEILTPASSREQKRQDHYRYSSTREEPEKGGGVAEGKGEKGPASAVTLSVLCR